MDLPSVRNLAYLPAALFILSACGGAERAQTGDDGSARTPGADTPSVASALPDGAQAISLLGEPLFPPELAEDVLTRRQEQLGEALADLEADPEGAEALIWAGRRYAYLGEYRQAIDLFTRGMESHPTDPRFYRHRGHRYITVRELDRAIADLQRAAELIQGTPDEVEPDGQPNALGIPTSTLHFNIYYHFGLAHYLKGDFQEAEGIYRRCMEASVHADSKVATAHWLYMTLRRSGKDREAEALLAELDLDALGQDIIESGSYLDLLRLYARSGTTGDFPVTELDPATLEGATYGYGVGNLLLYNDRPEAAREVFQGIVGARGQWAAFGYIAAEADLARIVASGGS